MLIKSSLKSWVSLTKWIKTAQTKTPFAREGGDGVTMQDQAWFAAVNRKNSLNFCVDRNTMKFSVRLIVFLKTVFLHLRDRSYGGRHDFLEYRSVCLSGKPSSGMGLRYLGESNPDTEGA